ncbi:MULTISPECIES: hypothetical protein [Streptomyces]|uniref:hypothetical protein n=1 Tax=Streptomyces TaxID=1883 RepID=UPI0004BD62A6|nr:MULTISPECIES: hypothetical protein [Streptomyces]KOG66869.1 hypothetical protein ADK77_16955 [Streptomyces antibioticus]
MTAQGQTRAASAIDVPRAKPVAIFTPDSARARLVRDGTDDVGQGEALLPRAERDPVWTSTVGSNPSAVPRNRYGVPAVAASTRSRDS